MVLIHGYINNFVMRRNLFACLSKRRQSGKVVSPDGDIPDRSGRSVTDVGSSHLLKKGVHR